MSRQALELALEALELDSFYGTKKQEAITAIKEALAQTDDKKCENCGEFGECCQNAQPKQEPVGQLLEEAYGRGQVMWFNKPKDESMLYTTPPQRKPLTDEEIDRIWVPHSIIQAPDRQRQAFARAIEAKLKEKNT